MRTYRGTIGAMQVWPGAVYVRLADDGHAHPLRPPTKVVLHEAGRPACTVSLPALLTWFLERGTGAEEVELAEREGTYGEIEVARFRSRAPGRDPGARPEGGPGSPGGGSGEAPETPARVADQPAARPNAPPPDPVR